MDDNAKIILHKDYTEQIPEGAGDMHIVRKVRSSTRTISFHKKQLPFDICQISLSLYTRYVRA